MAQGYFGYKVTLPYLSGMSYDVSENTFHFRVPDTDDWDELDLLSAIESFYVDAPPGETLSVSQFLSLEVSRAAGAAKISRWEIPVVEGPLGPPTLAASFTLDAHLTADPIINFPEETVVCLSYHGSLTGIPEVSGTTRPRSRRRGRIYVGPLTSASSTAGDDSTSAPRPSTLFRTVLVKAGAQLATAASAAGAEYSVFSRTSWAMNQILEFWSDNAYDTMRKRGIEPTSRVSA